MRSFFCKLSYSYQLVGVEVLVLLEPQSYCSILIDISTEDSSMRVQTEEWRQFIPGVRRYKGKKTLFYNGEKLWDGSHGSFFGQPLIYDEEERETWEVVIVLPGVEVIPRGTFLHCKNIKTVIMTDTVRRIESYGFDQCRSLVFVKLSRNLEFIGEWAFSDCHSLTFIFIPPSCREIEYGAFFECKKLTVLQVPRHTQLGRRVIAGTAFIEASPFGTNNGEYANDEEVNNWIKNRHQDEQFSLHRACSSYNPLDEVIFEIIKRQGLKAFKKTDRIGVTASQYLSENPFTEIEEQKIVKLIFLI